MSLSFFPEPSFDCALLFCRCIVVAGACYALPPDGAGVRGADLQGGED